MEKIDIIALVITLGVGFVLYSILGKRTGHTSSFSPGATGPSEPEATPEGPMTPGTVNVAPPLITGLKQLVTLDPKFNHVKFANDIRAIFEETIHAFVKGDRDLLQKNLSPALYAAYNTALIERETAGQQVELSHFRCVKEEITDIQVHDHHGQITVKFSSEQIQLLKDQDGKILEGNPDIIDDIQEMWVFEKELKKPSSHWILVKTYAAA